MSKKKKEPHLYPLMGKWIIAFDTMIDGWQCIKDGEDKPVLYNSYDEAVTEMFKDALSMLSNRTKEELEEYNEGITFDIIKEMKNISKLGDVKAMDKFFEKYPNTNDNNEFVVPAEEYIHGRKAIFGNEGLKIIGTQLK